LRLNCYSADFTLHDDGDDSMNRLFCNLGH